ncbi:hypothetical protein [Roseiarcus sp.]|uniref:hypothetical protein n=1 Tax=Roseiarcus sp. TaxID=1969460 RepID=UPI003F9B5C90
MLTRATLAILRDEAKKAGFAGQFTVYGEACRLSADRLAREAITFKQTPYDVKARK